MLRATERKKLELTIRVAIVDGPTRHKRDAFLKNVETLIARYRSVGGDQSLAVYFDLSVSHLKGHVPAAAIIEAALVLADAEGSSDLTRVLALALACKLSTFVVPVPESLALHARAEKIAMGNRWYMLATWIVAHRVLVGLYRDDLAEAGRSLRRARALFKYAVAVDRPVPPEAQYIEARLLAHRAKLFVRARLRRARPHPHAASLINKWYSQVVEIEREHDHFRTNHLTEWAEELCLIHGGDIARTTESASKTLELAVRGLDTHICDLCWGYFYQTRAQLLLFQARDAPIWHSREAQALLTQSIHDANLSYQHFSATRHASTQFAHAIKEEASMSLAALDRPRRIFLSHKGANKPVVRRYRDALSALGFEPWLDEKDLPAGVVLHRGLQAGIQQSCATVFFITPAFSDERFLADEIDYSMEEWRERKPHFSIITLSLADDSGHRGVIPKPLERFVYKSPNDDMEGLLDIVQALPLKLPPPAWPPEV